MNGPPTFQLNQSSRSRESRILFCPSRLAFIGPLGDYCHFPDKQINRGSVWWCGRMARRRETVSSGSLEALRYQDVMKMLENWYHSPMNMILLLWSLNNVWDPFKGLELTFSYPLIQTLTKVFLPLGHSRIHDARSFSKIWQVLQLGVFHQWRPWKFWSFGPPSPPCHIHDHATYQYCCPLSHYPPSPPWARTSLMEAP